MSSRCGQLWDALQVSARPYIYVLYIHSELNLNLLTLPRYVVISYSYSIIYTQCVGLSEPVTVLEASHDGLRLKEKKFVEKNIYVCI